MRISDLFSQKDLARTMDGRTGDAFFQSNKSTMLQRCIRHHLLNLLRTSVRRPAMTSHHALHHASRACVFLRLSRKFWGFGGRRRPTTFLLVGIQLVALILSTVLTQVRLKQAAISQCLSLDLFFLPLRLLVKPTMT